MRWLANMAAGVKSLFQKRRLESELDEELESFLAASVENKLKGGLPASAAR